MKRDNKQELQRQYKIAHQILCLKEINFEKRTLMGFVELTIHPARPDLTEIRLNCKQSKIYLVNINAQWEAEFTYDDPSQLVCMGDAKQRNLDYFQTCHLDAMNSTDADLCSGEIAVQLPSELAPILQEMKPFKMQVEFILEQPQGGVHFVLPDVEGTLTERGAHLFTCGKENSARLWFPCVDCFSEPCTWKLEFTVDAELMVISCGELVDTVLSEDGKTKTYYFYLGIPTAAPNIGFAVGPFESHVDPKMNELIHFCLPGMKQLLIHTCSYVHQSFEFYEELISISYPYNDYKQVFVDESYVDGNAYASMSILSTNLLFSPQIIDQTILTRKVMARLVAEQFFGCFIAMQSWSDAWLTKGIAGYLSSLFQKKTFGNNEYRYQIAMLVKEVGEYEQQVGGILLDPSRRESNLPFSVKNAHTVSPRYAEMMERKALLVIRMLEKRLGTELLLQVLNKLLALSVSASSQQLQMPVQAGTCAWSNMLISTSSFLKIIYTVTGKDVLPFIEQWIHQSGCARFFGSFNFNRKRNVVELEIKQDLTARGGLRYVGPLTVTIQELDGSFNHTFNVEENKTKFEITCHSKSRRNKKKKIPLMTGEEVDMDLAAMDADSPVLWLRVDPDMQLLRQVMWEQPDYMWQYQLKYERDVVAQREAIFALERFTTPQTRLSLTDTIENEHCFYRVRMQACTCLTKVANSMHAWQGPPAMMNIFRKMYGSHACSVIIRQNNFSNFIHYFLLKQMVQAMANLRDVHQVCIPEILRFLLDLFKYNDNSKNKYSDNYYRAALVDAISQTVTPAVSTSLSLAGGPKYSETMSGDMKLILEEITLQLNLEKLMPCYRLTVTVSCLRALRQLQRFAHLPSDASIFRQYAQYGIFRDVRLASLDCLIDLIRAEANAEQLDFVLTMVENDKDFYVRHRILRMLTINPPFKKLDLMQSPLNTEALVERLWKMMNSSLSFDSRLRCGVADLYYVMYGRSRPSCLPVPDSLLVLNLKEKRSTLSPTVQSLSRPLHSMAASGNGMVEQMVVEEGEVVDMDMNNDVIIEAGPALELGAAESSEADGQSQRMESNITGEGSSMSEVTMENDDTGEPRRKIPKLADTTGPNSPPPPTPSSSMLGFATSTPMAPSSGVLLDRSADDGISRLSEDSADEGSSTLQHVGLSSLPATPAIPSSSVSTPTSVDPSSHKSHKSKKKKKKNKHKRKHKHRHEHSDRERGESRERSQEGQAAFRHDDMSQSSDPLREGAIRKISESDLVVTRNEMDVGMGPGADLFSSGGSNNNSPSHPGDAQSSAIDELSSDEMEAV